jgi:hypothetical protein
MSFGENTEWGIRRKEQYTKELGEKTKDEGKIEVKKGIFNAKGAEISQNGTSGVNFGVTEERIGISSSMGGNMCF